MRFQLIRLLGPEDGSSMHNLLSIFFHRLVNCNSLYFLFSCFLLYQLLMFLVFCYFSLFVFLVFFSYIVLFLFTKDKSRLFYQSRIYKQIQSYGNGDFNAISIKELYFDLTVYILCLQQHNQSRYFSKIISMSISGNCSFFLNTFRKWTSYRKTMILKVLTLVRNGF